MELTAAEVWSRILDEARAALPEQAFRTWLAPTEAIAFSQDTLIVSTPNPFYQGQVWKIWRYGKPMVHEDHTNWQDPTTLSNLLRRTGFEPTEGYWIQPPREILKTWKRLLRPYFAHGFMILARPK